MLLSFFADEAAVILPCVNVILHKHIHVCYFINVLMLPAVLTYNIFLLQVQRCSLELTIHSLLHASVGLSEHDPEEFLSDSNVFVVYLEHMVSSLDAGHTAKIAMLQLMSTAYKAGLRQLIT